MEGVMSWLNWALNLWPQFMNKLLNKVGLGILTRWWPMFVHGYANWTGDVDLVYFGPLVFWLLQIGVYIVVGTFFTVLDVWHRPASIYRWKVQPKVEFHAEGSRTNPSLAVTVWRCALAFAVELVGLIALQLGFSRIGLGIYCTAEWPSHLESIFHAIAIFFCSEFGFYFTHRSLHSPWLYRHVHYQHHQFKAPTALAAQAQHPVEILWATVIGLTVWPFLFHSHAMVFFIGAIIGTWGSMHDHCGFWLFSSSGAQPFFHDWHHERVNCNYGFMGLVDGWMGTDVSWKQEFETRKTAILSTKKTE